MEHCNEGVEAVAEAMRRRFGVDRSPEAVRRHAYRIGAPLVEYEICPSCGGKFDHLTRDGVCRRCRTGELAKLQRKRNDALREEIRANQSPEALRKAEREYEKERAQATRLRRKLRLPD